MEVTFREHVPCTKHQSSLGGVSFVLTTPALSPWWLLDPRGHSYMKILGAGSCCLSPTSRQRHLEARGASSHTSSHYPCVVSLGLEALHSLRRSLSKAEGSLISLSSAHSWGYGGVGKLSPDQAWHSQKSLQERLFAGREVDPTHTPGTTSESSGAKLTL